MNDPKIKIDLGFSHSGKTGIHSPYCHKRKLDGDGVAERIATDEISYYWPLHRVISLKKLKPISVDRTRCNKETWKLELGAINFPRGSS